MSKPSHKEIGLIKGALRRVFSRSDLRKSALQATIVKHSDPSRPRVKTWCKCPLCGRFEAVSSMQVDHILPLVPFDTTLALYIELNGWDALIARLWCDAANLQAICIDCHDEKTKAERKLRKKPRKAVK